MSIPKIKDPQLQAMASACYNKGANDFMRRRGGSLQSAFMHGYLKHPKPNYIPIGSWAWAAWKAGKARRKDEEKGVIQPAQVINQRLFELDSKSNPQK